ncbi:MAG TPA: TonB-dependent receptor [Flavobacteriales bacterium]|nr:TonB-dependent receptor [Flavobacteriales bacterium]
MKFVKLIVVFIFFVFHARAQNGLVGHVTVIGSQTPVRYATVAIPDLHLETLTDSTGHYVLDKLPRGKFLVECRKKGMGITSAWADVNGVVQLDFSLETAVVEMHEITITGTTQSTGAGFNPLAIKTMKKEELFENASTNLIDNITKNPGVNQLSTGAAVSKPVIRGLGYNRLVTLNNNIRQEGQQWGDEHGIEIDEYSVDRVEIIKGPGSLMYGSDAIAGVINFLGANPVPVGTIRSSLLMNYQTNNQLQAYSLHNAGNLKGINWLLRGTMKMAGNYKNKYDGYVYNSGFKEYDVNGYLGINRKWGFSHVYFSSFNQTIAMVEGERDSLGNFVREYKINDTLTGTKTVSDDELQGYRYDVPRQQVNHHRVSNSTKLFFGKTNFTLNTAFQQNIRREFGNVLDETDAELFFVLNTFNYDARVQLPEMHKWLFTVGASGMHQQNANKGNEALVPDYSLFDVGGYVFFKRPLSKKADMAGGVRYDNRFVNTEALYIDTLDELTTTPTAWTTEKFKSLNGTYNAITASLGVTVQFTPQVNLKLNVARGFRAPNIAEIASNGKHEGTLRYELGDVNLKAETSLQGDVGFGINGEHVSSELAVFYNDIQHYIYAEKLQSVYGGDSIADVNDPASVFKYTQGNAALYGGEYSIDVHPHPFDWLHVENSISMVTGMQKNMPDSMTYLPFIPAARYQGELRTEIEKWGSLRDLYVALNVNHFFEQQKIYEAYDTETASAAYTLVNFSAGSGLVNKKGNTILNFVLSVNNVFDVAYQHHLSRIRYAAVNPVTGRPGVFNMGRNFSVKVLIPIDSGK